MEDLLRDYIRAELVLNHQLNESAVTDAVANQALQWLVGAAAEYGLGAITLPAGGAGLAIGPATETIVDTVFAAEGVAVAVDAVSNIGNELGEFSSSFKEALDAYSGSDWDNYYSSLVSMTRQAVRLIGEKAEEGIEEVAEVIVNALKKMVQKLVEVMNKGLKVVIPDASIGAAAAAAIETIVMEAAEDSYTLLTGAISKVEILSDFVEEPEAAVKFFESALQQLVDMVNRLATKISNASITDKAKALALFGPVGGTLVLKLGDDGFEKIAQVIQKQIPVVVKIVETTLKIIVPAVITAMAFLQILLSGDWQQEDDNEKIEEAMLKLVSRDLQSILVL